MEQRTVWPGRVPARPPVVVGRSGVVEMELVVVGAHGGAGVSTLAVLLGGSWDLGVVPRTASGRTQVHRDGRPLVLVALGTVPGASRAIEALGRLGSGVARETVLVVVADGVGPEPREARARFRMVEGRVAGLVRMPYVPGLRMVDDPSVVVLPRRARRALQRIRALAATVDGRVW